MTDTRKSMTPLTRAQIEAIGTREAGPSEWLEPMVPLTVAERDALVAKIREMAPLLLEARDALPAISLTSARLHHIDLSLADRIEKALEPWKLP